MDKITGKNSNRKFKLGMHSYTPSPERLRGKLGLPERRQDLCF